MIRSLDEFVVEGITTTVDLHKKILNHKKFIDSDFDTNWMSKEKFFYLGNGRFTEEKKDKLWSLGLSKKVFLTLVSYGTKA